MVKEDVKNAILSGLRLIGSDPAITRDNLTTAKRLVERGRWWPKVQAYINAIDAAAVHPGATAEQIGEMMKGLRDSVRSGCVIVEKKKGGTQ